MKERYTANNNYILREIAGEAILVSVGEEIADFCGIVKLNAAARVLWEVLQREVTKEELVSELMEQFEVSEERAEEDAEVSLQMMLARRLIHYV